MSTEHKWQPLDTRPALLSALRFVDEQLPHWKCSEAVADCPHCNVGYIVAWVHVALAAERPAPDIGGLYSELLYAVERKHPNESRHETALRYIRQATHQTGGPACEAKADK